LLLTGLPVMASGSSLLNLQMGWTMRSIVTIPAGKNFTIGSMVDKRILNLPEQAGLEGLKQALQFRLYAFINKQSITDETPDSFVFRMNDCRVQSARKEKDWMIIRVNLQG